MKKTGKTFISRDRTLVMAKIKEAFSSVLPITAIVLVLCFTITPIDNGVFLSFIVGAIAVIVGTGLFTLGADVAMMPIGEYVSKSILKTKKIWLIIPIYFLVGILITISEPDLQVLAGQLKETIDSWVLIVSIGVGVGVFLVIAFLHIVLKMKLKYILLLFYTAVFVLSFFVPNAFVPLAFDSGGVTTGPMSVPFIIAIGTGIASIRSDSEAESDGFGLTALCSIGPILSVMILGIIFNPESIQVSPNEPVIIENSKNLITKFTATFPHYLKEVGIALLPIVAFYFITQLFGYRQSKHDLARVIVGIVYTYIGLVLFLTGVNFGFLPVGNLIGKIIGGGEYAWAMIPIGMVIGFFVVAAEPAVHVLTKQVYEITSGAIPKKALSISLMIGTAISVGLAMLRIYLNIPILYLLIPCYLIALALMFIVPEIFTAIAFDSGGVASGAMTSSFLLPLALGFCSAMGRDVATQGFGLVAMVAMTPLITIQILGLTYKIKLARIKKKEKEVQPAQVESKEILTEEIID